MSPGEKQLESYLLVAHISGFNSARRHASRANIDGVLRHYNIVKRSITGFDFIEFLDKTCEFLGGFHKHALFRLGIFSQKCFTSSAVHIVIQKNRLVLC